MGLSVLRVFVDGVTVSEIPISGKSKDLALLQTTFPPGKWITFAAEDEQGLRSSFRAFQLGRPRYPGKLNVLAFGADKFKRAQYQDQPVNDLGYASVDAKRFEAATKQLVGPSYSSYSGELIDGNSANEEYLVTELRRAAAATQKGDTLIVFFASHGVTDKSGFSLVLPSHVPGGEATILPFTTISSALKLVQGRVFVFLDACHSADATQDAASEQLASNNHEVIVISASKGRQSSLENSSWGGGIFTSAIIGALANSKQNPFSIETLYAQIRATVISKTNGQQTPWFRRSIWQGPQSIN
jgi:hypothetical protein